MSPRLKPHIAWIDAVLEADRCAQAKQRQMEDFQQYLVEQAVAQALSLGAISFDAVKMLPLERLEKSSGPAKCRPTSDLLSGDPQVIWLSLAK